MHTLPVDRPRAAGARSHPKKASRDPAPRPLDAQEEAGAERAVAGARVWIRDLYVLLRDTGIRLHEALALRAVDIASYTDGKVDLRIERAKGGAGRTVPVLTRRARRRLASMRSGPPDRWLFPGRWKDSPITTTGARLAWYDACDAAGIPRINPHRLRATFATELARAGVPIWTVQAALGWRKLETAARYVQAEEVRRVVRDLGR